MIFRLAEAADIPALVELRFAYLREDRGTLSASEEQALCRQLPAYFHAHLGRDCFAYVCEEGEHIVSTVLLLVTERPANPSFLTGRIGTVVNVYTRPSYRRRGLAGALMKQAMDAAVPLGLSYLELSATEAGAPLYRKLGFVPRQSHYLSMKYELPAPSEE